MDIKKSFKVLGSKYFVQDINNALAFLKILICKMLKFLLW